MKSNLIFIILTIFQRGLSKRSLSLYQDSLNIIGGHSKECFSFLLISFESCKQLFLLSSCFYMKYENKVCSLHDSSLIDFKKTIFTNEAIILTKLTNTTAILIPNLSISATRKYQKCLHKNNKNNNNNNNNSFNLLPKLGIVISVTSDWVKSHETGVKSLESNFLCYAKVHNYSFYLNIMPNMSPSKFYYQRHRSILHNYLPYHQYILHLDADSLILNHSRSLDPYLSNSKVDIHLHLHENSEVTAAIYLVKNSFYSRCFLELWSNFSPMHSDIIQDTHSIQSYDHLDISNNNNNNNNQIMKKSLDSEFLYLNTYEVPNYDNGDLVAGLFNLLYPKKYFQCLKILTSFDKKTWLSFSNSYHQTIVECWKSTHHNLFRYIYRNILPKTKIRIYYPHEGFWRTKGKMNRFEKWWDDLFGVCFPKSDIIGHGWKAMAKTLWPLPENEINSNSNSFHIYQDINITQLYLTKQKRFDSIDQSICRINEIKNGYGANPHCKWITEDEELEISQKYCLWRSHACNNNNNNNNDNNNDNNVNEMISTSLLSCESSKKCYQKCLNQHTSTCGNLINKTTYNVTKLSDLLIKQTTAKFGVENENWWKDQLCATCPL